MTSTSFTDSNPAPSQGTLGPTLGLMLTPVLAAPIVAFVVFGLGAGTAAPFVAACALATAVLVGAPLLFWAVDTGTATPRRLIAVGALAGAVPFAAALGSGMLGLYIRSADLAYVQWVLSHGASIPMLGAIPWSRFAWLVALGMISGALSLGLAAVTSRIQQRSEAK